MELKYVTGCVCDSLTLDGVETVDLPIEELQEALLKVIKSISKEDVLQDILICIMEGQGEYKCLQCGDTINEFTLNID
jgi:hypothetical protein